MMAGMTPLEIAMRQRAAEQERVLENPGALAQGFSNMPGTAYRYLSTRGLPGIGQDVVSMGKMLGSAVVEDPMGFAADAVLAPLSALRDVSEVRSFARQAREAGDADTADKMEQLAAMSVFGAIPVAGAAVKKSVKAGMKAAKKGAPLVVKPAETVVEKAPLAVKPLSEKQFYRRYLAHKDLRSTTSEQKADVLKSVQEEGFRSGWLLPAYRGGEPRNVIDVKYAPRKGDRVYLVPLANVNETRRNPPTIAPGWKPAPYEAVDVEEDYQPLYDLYRKAFEKQNLTNKAHGGRVSPLAVKRK